ncbi:hypothetical protein BGZ94_010416 [Podila epigama]|nr:hypothetical protein BGZ94_010416 [Podila epigama]
MAGYYPGQQAPYGYPQQQQQMPLYPQQPAYPAASPYPPPAAQQQGYYQAPPVYPQAGYPGAPTPPPHYATGYPGYPPVQPQSQAPPQEQPYAAYQDAKNPNYASQQSYPPPPSAGYPGQTTVSPPSSVTGASPASGGEVKDLDFWLRAYPRPTTGPSALTQEELQFWYSHINYNGNQNQSFAQAQTQYQGAASTTVGEAVKPDYAYPQNSQYPQYQPPVQEDSDKKQGHDWMKLAGGVAAGGLAIAGTKKLFEKFTDNKKPAHHH